MIRYKGKLATTTAEKIKRSSQLLKKLAAPVSALGRVSTRITTIEETIEQYNAGITIDEIKAWVWYRKSQGIPMHTWKNYHVEMTPALKKQYVSSGVLFFDPTTKSLVPFPVFVFGNIYEKLAKLPKFQEEITTNFGASVYENHLKVLTDLKPKPLSIQNPIEKERPVILAISETAKNFQVSSLRPDSGVILSEATDLQDAFKNWLRQLPATDFHKTRAYEVIAYYLNNENKPRSVDKIEFQAIKKITRDEGERLFKIFLHTALETTDQLRIDAEYNSKYNATAPLQYHKIPIGLQISRKIGGGFDLAIKPAQREGIAFMELVGSGVIAYDVGVGKTITAICEVAAAIDNGKCLRPLVIVPNPTYKNWIKEMMGDETEGLYGVLTGTGIILNDFYNLGSDYDHIDLEKQVPERSITLVSYEGFQKIGFNEDTQKEHFNELSEILAQRGISERNEEKDNEKLREVIGLGIKDTIADIETLGFDYLVIDEAHNFKNIFSEVKADKENGKQFHVKGGQPSNRGVKAFFMCNYIQRKYGRNVCLLTATPFTNSPLEIYSMLSLVAYDYLVKNNIRNIRVFFEQYIQETSENVVGVDGEIKQKDVVKSFNNRISLQKLINSHINFKTGEEANIPRPCKVNLPKTTVLTDEGLKKLSRDNQVLTYLSLTEQQSANQLALNIEAASGADRDDSGKLLRLMNESLNNALSPFLYDKTTPSDYKDFVESSPKIHYTLKCIKSVKDWHEKRNQPVSGQVIYIDRGKEYFKYIKEYLEKELGYKKNVSLKSNPKQKVDEVEFVIGGMPPSKKEKIKDAFNEGTCKIIIGTSTIKEGINLQMRSSVLYNLYPDWNPTGIRQLEGRIWRQKNYFGYVRIVMPLMENSMDVFVFQKLDEKTARINNLWSKSDRGNVLDEESLDPNEVKYALVTDLNVLLRFELKQIEAETQNNLQVLQSQLEDLNKYTDVRFKYENQKELIVKRIIGYANSFHNTIIYNKNYNRITFSNVPQLKSESITKEIQSSIDRANKVQQQLNEIVAGNREDKAIIVAYQAYKRLSSTGLYDWEFDRYKDSVSQIGKLTRTLFTSRGYDVNTDISKITKEIENDIELTTADLDEIQTDNFQNKLYEKIKAEKERLAIKGGTLEQRVKDFASLNHLLSYRFTDIDHNSCSIPVKELKPKLDNDKERRLKLAKAKAKAVKLKLKLKLAA